MGWRDSRESAPVHNINDTHFKGGAVRVNEAPAECQGHKRSYSGRVSQAKGEREGAAEEYTQSENQAAISYRSKEGPGIFEAEIARNIDIDTSASTMP